MKKNVILTATDKKYGDFFIEHWLKSLWENVNLKNIDIAVIDYGLSTAQRYYLDNHNVICIPANRDGHVTVIRFRDYYTYLSSNDYNQVLICDSGDIIFQDDISHLFDMDTQQYRAVCEDNKSPFSFFINDDFFSKEEKHELIANFINNKMINAGFILGPRLKMKQLCKLCITKIRNKDKFGPDQILINMLLHKKGFKELDKGYNFVISSSNNNFFVKNGKFYFDNGKIIPIIHNAGNLKFLRPIDNFGYGDEFNHLKYPLYSTLKMINAASNNIYDFSRVIRSEKNNVLPFNNHKQKYKRKKNVI